VIGRLAATILSLVILTACADPKYISQDGKLSPSQKTEVTRAEFPTSRSLIFMTWEQMPTNEDFGSFLLKIGRENLADQSPVPQEITGEIAVELWMPSMGHGSSPVTVTKVDVGTYRATQVFFTMPGDWEIRVKRVVSGVMVEQANLPLRF